MKNRLQYHREKLDITQEELGKGLGVTKQTVWKWENNIAKIHPKHHEKLKKILGISDEDVYAIINGSDFIPEQVKANLLPEGKYYKKEQKTYSNVRQPSAKGFFVPIISQAAAATCNPGIQPLLDCINEHSEEKTWFKEAKEGDFVIEVSGESMNPWYPDGTLLLVRPYQELRNGQRVVAVLDTGEIIFKIYSAKADKICLFSIDKNGQDFIWTKPNVPLRYICRVIASQRNEDAIDEEMNHCGIRHDWQVKLSNV